MTADGPQNFVVSTGYIESIYDTHRKEGAANIKMTEEGSVSKVGTNEGGGPGDHSFRQYLRKPLTFRNCQDEISPPLHDVDCPMKK